MNTILDLTEVEALTLVGELLDLDDKTHIKVKHVQAGAGVSVQEALEYVVNDSPVLWAKVYINWTARDYQKEILMQGKKAKKLVLRLGRRLGKTECMDIDILWHALTQPNKDPNRGPNDTYDILVLTPFETQIDLIFSRLDQLINGSPILSAEISRSINHRYEFKNKSVIQGLTLGAGNGKEGASTRGQRADLLVYDEIDYGDEKSITTSLNIANEDRGRIKIIAASTPCGKHESFYKWCTESTLTFRPKQEDIDNFRFTGYIEERTIKGNGWTQIFAPSTVNKTLLEINSDTGQTYLQDIKDELSDLRYQQEVMAEFGEEQMGVYKKEHIQRAVNLSYEYDHRYITDRTEAQKEAYIRGRRSINRSILIAGIDWDLSTATPVIVAVELDKHARDSQGNIQPMFKVMFREEMPRTQFTMDNAINRIIELNNIYDFDWIAADRGYGDTQIEQIKKHGTLNPETGLHEKTIGYHLGSKLEIRDPHTWKKTKVNFKPFMVSNSARIFERNKIILGPTDKVLKRQLENYRIKSISVNGIPTYTDVDEHSLDAMNLALLCFEQKYGELMKQVISTKILGLPQIDPYRGLVPPRATPQSSKTVVALNFSKNNGYIVDVTGSSRKSRPQSFSRSFTR